MTRHSITAIRLDPLADGVPAELVKAAERGEAGRGEGSVEHAEVFRMVSVGTSILEDLAVYPRTSRQLLMPPLRKARWASLSSMIGGGAPISFVKRVRRRLVFLWFVLGIC